jgi:hypothetical protein
VHQDGFLVPASAAGLVDRAPFVRRRGSDSVQRRLAPAESCFKIDDHGLDHAEDFFGARELPILSKDGVALHAFEDEWMGSAQQFIVGRTAGSCCFFMPGNVSVDGQIGTSSETCEDSAISPFCAMPAP